MIFDAEFINPKGSPGIIYSVEASDENEAKILSALRLAVSSQWTPEQFKIISVRESIYSEEGKE